MTTDNREYFVAAELEEAQRRIQRALTFLEGRDPDTPEPTEPPWMAIARAELGVREVPGPAHEAQVLAYLATCHRDEGGNLGDWGAGRDETPWCSAFVNWVLLRAGIEGTRHAAARSWRDWGTEANLVGRPGEAVPTGSIAVLTRDGGGHVAFVVGFDLQRLQVRLLGGNQGNAVSIQAYPIDRVITYRWPSGYSLTGERTETWTEA